MNINNKYIAFLILLTLSNIACPVFAQNVDADAKKAGDPIKYSGVWLSGKYCDADKNFPVGKHYSLQFGEGSSNDLSKDLLALIRKESKPNGNRLVDSIAPDDYTPQASVGKALVMACAINYEHVDQVEIGGINKVMAEVGFDLVICDFSNRSVVVCLPGRIMRTDVTESAIVSEAKKKEMLEELYRKELPKQFVKLAKEHGPEIMGLDSAAVTKVTVFDEAKKILPNWLSERYEDYFGNVLGSNFYEGCGLPILPFSRGNEMVFCAMREGVSDASSKVIESAKESGSGVSFVLKKPEYQVELVIPGFQTVTATSNDVGKLVQNCSYSRITIKKGEDVIYTAQHDGSVRNLIPKGSSEKVPWLAYSDAVNEMFFKSSKQIKSKISASMKKQDSPLLIIDPSAIKSLFVACAPWAIISKNQNP